MESASLLVLHVVIRRLFGLSLLHQLAFVVETHRMIVQANLKVWILTLVQFCSCTSAPTTSGSLSGSRTETETAIVVF
ncbi:hypothetical protein PINS_up023835 [Pythium insidiosum]|nr:hypothetical protein PINS_up023835 [Pythium insidiosum]